MAAIGNKSSECSSKNITGKEGKEAERQGEYDMEFVEVPVIDRADAMSV